MTNRCARDVEDSRHISAAQLKGYPCINEAPGNYSGRSIREANDILVHSTSRIVLMISSTSSGSGDSVGPSPLTGDVHADSSGTNFKRSEVHQIKRFIVG